MIQEVRSSISEALKEIPAVIWVFLIGQLVATVIWGVRLDSRVDNVERKQIENLPYLDELRRISLHASLLEERLRIIARDVERLERMRAPPVPTPP